ncbi:MAG: lipopolysaccharide biosynthesis protein [Cyclobacteriaceae bacterium]|nr:lipopolysaccharide biosynthesis protein [Cyclobacteriaceae bacterium]
MKDLRKKAARGIFWVFIDRAGSQFIGFVITIFLARLLSPNEFGLVAMASVVIAITRIFIDGGLRDSLIQKQNCTQSDYSTIFLFNMVVSVFLLLVIFFIAPYVASFYGYAELTDIIRVLGVIPFIGGLGIVQETIIQKDLTFNILAKMRLPAFIISGIIGLAMAWYGYGIWSLVIQAILEILFFNILLWLNSKWRPVFEFDRKLFKFHWRHGSRLLVISALGTIHRNIFSLIIGKFFSPSQLGFYSRAESFKTVTLNNTVGIIQTVSYPLLAKFQDNNEQLKSKYRLIQQSTILILLPIIAVLIVGAEPIIEFLLTKKWLPAAPILQVLMVAMVFSPFNSINHNILKVKRRTDLLLRINIINKVILIGVVFITVNLGFDYLVMTNLFMAVISIFINNYYTNKLIGFSFKEQLLDLYPLLVSFIIAVFSALILDPYFVYNSLFIGILVRSLFVIGVYILIIYLMKRNFLFEARKNLMMLFGK